MRLRFSLLCQKSAAQGRGCSLWMLPAAAGFPATWAGDALPWGWAGGSRPNGCRSPRAQDGLLLPEEEPSSPLKLLCWKKGFPRRNNLHWEEPFVARLSYCSFRKWPFSPCSLKDKATQGNRNGMAVTEAVARRSDLIHEISSYGKNLLWFLQSYALRFLPSVLIMPSEKRATRESVKTIFLPGK